MDHFKGKRIESINELEIDKFYIIDNEPALLVCIAPNRFVFKYGYGVEHVNRAMLMGRLEEGIFAVIE